jgi:predicted GNAT family N-acyltransferase
MTAGLENRSIRIARVEEILELRTDVLIRGSERVSAHFDGDTAADTRHFGIFIGKRNIACASVMNAALDGVAASQVRGMATHPTYRSLGLGGQLLDFIEAELRRAKSFPLIWCNARIGALGFYEKAGWTTVSDVFDVEGVGPHRRMTKTIGVSRPQS